MNFSLGEKASDTDVKTDPFPYLVIKDVLPQALCEQLIAEYPAMEAMGVDSSANNKRWSYSAREVANNDKITEAWKSVIEYFSSEAFYHELVDLFGESIIAQYPKRFPNKQSLKRLRPGIRKVHDYSEKDILLDAQICGNTPVTEATSVRTNHVDSPLKLIAGLLYLRTGEDDSVGGDLELRKFKPSYGPKEKKESYEGVYVDHRHTDLCDIVQYERNVLVLFVNSPESFHGVSTRLPTQHNRIFINIVAAMQKPLFSLPESKSVKIKKFTQYQKGQITVWKNKVIVWLKSLKWLRKLFGKPAI